MAVELQATKERMEVVPVAVELQAMKGRMEVAPVAVELQAMKELLKVLESHHCSRSSQRQCCGYQGCSLELEPLHPEHTGHCWHHHIECS